MKKLKKVLICSMVCAAIFCGCKNTAQHVDVVEEVGEILKSNKTIKKEFADPVFEKYLRVALGNLDGELTEEELASVKQISIDTNSAFSIFYDGIVDGRISLDGKGDVEVPYDRKDDRHIQSLEDLEKLPNLEAVYINKHNYSSSEKLVEFRNFDFVENLPKLKAISGHSVADTLKPLENCHSLEVLSLTLSRAKNMEMEENEEEIENMEDKEDEEEIEPLLDLSPLKHCPNLTDLELWMNNYYIDISPLKQCKNLGSLTLYDISDEIDISPLAECPKLGVLDLSFRGDRVLDLSMFRGNDEIVAITVIHCNEIINFDALLDIPNLFAVRFPKEFENESVFQKLQEKGVMVR